MFADVRLAAPVAAPAKFETEIKHRNPHDVARTSLSLVPRKMQIGPDSRGFPVHPAENPRRCRLSGGDGGSDWRCHERFEVHSSYPIHENSTIGLPSRSIGDPGSVFAPAARRLSCSRSRPSSISYICTANASRQAGAFSRIVTNSSAAVGWIPIVASNCALVAPHCSATAKPWIISPASVPIM